MRITNNILKGCGIECDSVYDTSKEEHVVECGEILEKISGEKVLFLCNDCTKRLRREIKEEK